MFRAAGCVDFIVAEQVTFHLKSQNITDETGTLVFGVPPVRNLSGVLLSQNRAEERLLRQTRWETAEPGHADEIKFRLAPRQVEGPGFNGPLVQERSDSLKITSFS